MRSWLWGPLACWLGGAALGWLGEFPKTGEASFRSATTFGLVLMISWSMSRMPSFKRPDRSMQYFLEFTLFAAFLFYPVCLAAGLVAQRLSGWGFLPPDSQTVLMTPTAYLLLWVLFRRGGGFPLLLLLATPALTVLLGWASWFVHERTVSFALTTVTLTLLGCALSLAGAACQRIRDHKRLTRR